MTIISDYAFEHAATRVFGNPKEAMGMKVARENTGDGFLLSI
ncbi:MAG TPA: hypothetical protein VGE26_10235 [Sphingobacteriaceae bacterium]